MIEKWNQIKDIPYEVSNFGNVKRQSNGINTYKGRPKAISKSSNGYLIFGAFECGKRTNVLVHRAVAEAFIKPISKDMEVNHKDGNKLNNHVSNLEIVTKSENSKHALKMRLSNLTALHNSKKYCGEDHWTHKKPERLARGDNNGSRKHPESILKGEQCHNSKLTDLDVKEIRYQYFGGITITVLAEVYKISYRSIWYVVNNKTWRHVL